MSRMTSSGIAALFHDYRSFAGPRLWLALGLMVVGAGAEAFGLLMVVPLASVAIDRGADGSMILASFGFRNGGGAGQWFAAALALFVAAMALRAIILFARDLLLARLQAEYEADLRLRAAATLAARGWPFASRVGQEGMQALLLTDVPRAAQASAYLQTIALSCAMLLAQFALAIFLSPMLALVAFGFMLAGGLLSARFAIRGVRRGFAISDSMEDSAVSGFRLHAGLKSALAQGAVGSFLREYRTSLFRAAHQYGQFARDYSLSRQAIGFGAAVVAAVLLLVGVQVLALPFPVLIASLVLFARMNAPAQLLQQSILQATAHAPSFAAIERRLGALERDPPAPVQEAAGEWTRLELKDVGYHHASGRGLAPISCFLARGEWLALVGPSGAGKTTFVDLVAGLLQPSSGSISVDGKPLPAVLTEWQAGIAYAGQDGALFNDSIRGNLMPPPGSDDADLWRALENVSLAERVRAFSTGLNQSVGDRGSQLSGGERQRLVIARALLRKPRLLILDEATAALDAESESAIIERLRALDPRPAALVVAHRESTLAHCDSRLAIQHHLRLDDPAFANETTSARINVATAKGSAKE
jgi:ATP-binding cassette subfamily C protein